MNRSHTISQYFHRTRAGLVRENKNVGRAILVLLLQWVACNPSAFAVPTYIESSVTETFVADSDVGDKTVVSGTGVGGLTLNRSVTKDGGTASGFASVQTITSPGAVGFSIANGTGVSRNDPKDVFTGTTSLEIDLHGLWRIDGQPWGPTVYDVAYFGILSQNPSQGDVGRFTLHADWHDGHTFDVDNSFTQFGSAYASFLYFVTHNPTTVPTGDNIELSASIGFYFTGHSEGGVSMPNLAGQVPEPNEASLLLAGVGLFAFFPLGRNLRRKAIRVAGSQMRRVAMAR